MSKVCEALGLIRQARVILQDETKTVPSRELSIVITRLEEAELWRQRDMFLKEPRANGISPSPKD